MNQKKSKQKCYTKSLHAVKYLFDRPADENGCLFSNGRYRTKIKPEDLPEWFVKVYMYRDDVYLSAKDVKQLYYKPCYFTNHLFKDDALYISYNEEIYEASELFGVRDYDHVLFGSSIPKFVEEVKKYSTIDVSEIETAISDKRDWFEKNYPDFENAQDKCYLKPKGFWSK